ncbi:MAG: hypothetical protein GYA53_06060 [Acidobacteria bacterium]|nr:hypothetical protein [Acidobacteriota bacterium]
MPLKPEDSEPLWIDNAGSSFTTQVQTAAGGGEETIPPVEAGVEVPAEEAAEAGAQMGTVSLLPGRSEVPVGYTLNVRLAVNSPVDITSLSLNVNYDSKVLRLKEIQRGDLVSQLGDKGSFLQDISASSGLAVLGFSSPDPAKGVNSGNLATLVFEVLGAGENRVGISSIQVLGVQGRAVNLVGGDMLVIAR